VQVLDQQVALPGPAAQQRLDFLRGYRINLTPLGGRFGPFSPLTGVLKGMDFVNLVTHGTSRTPQKPEWSEAKSARKSLNTIGFCSAEFYR
jgi:hypothetical protein